MSTPVTPITIAGTTFDRVRYDAEADVLYLHVGNPSSAVEFEESPEGHHLRLDSQGRLVGLTLVGIRHDLEAGRDVAVTLPERVRLNPADLRLAITAA